MKFSLGSLQGRQDFFVLCQVCSRLICQFGQVVQAGPVSKQAETGLTEADKLPPRRATLSSIL
jgi:hypothetical protein